MQIFKKGFQSALYAKVVPICFRQEYVLLGPCVGIGVLGCGAYTPTPEVIINETARYFSVTPEDIRGQKRTKSIANARHISIYLVRTLTNLSLNDIGTYFEDRNHTTVLASINKIEAQMKVDSGVSATIRDITSNINSRQ